MTSRNDPKKSKHNQNIIETQSKQNQHTIDTGSRGKLILALVAQFVHTTHMGTGAWGKSCSNRSTQLSTKIRAAPEKSRALRHARLVSYVRTYCNSFLIHTYVRTYVYIFSCALLLYQLPAGTRYLVPVHCTPYLVPAQWSTVPDCVSYSTGTILQPIPCMQYCSPNGWPAVPSAPRKKITCLVS